MTDKLIFTEMLRRCRINYVTRNMGDDVFLEGTVFQFSPVGHLVNAYADSGDDE